jgi:nucleoside-diphosphate-sugar epimerase
MRILLTGSSGFLGGIILNEIIKDNSVKTIGRSSKPRVSIDHICIDISKETYFFENDDFDLVIHSAGVAHLSEFKKKTKTNLVEVNTNITANLLKSLETCSKLPERIVFISSVSVYGLDCGTNVSERTVLGAKDSYGVSKIASEKLIQEWGELNNVNVTILRLPLIIGNNAKGNLAKLIKGIQMGYYFHIDGGNARKSMVLGEDIAKNIINLSNFKGVFNLTDGYHPSFRELAQVICRQVNKPEPVNFNKNLFFLVSKVGDFFFGLIPINSRLYRQLIYSLTFDDSYAREVAGWKPKSVLKEFKIV